MKDFLGAFLASLRADGRREPILLALLLATLCFFAGRWERLHDPAMAIDRALSVALLLATPLMYLALQLLPSAPAGVAERWHGLLRWGGSRASLGLGSWLGTLFVGVAMAALFATAAGAGVVGMGRTLLTELQQSIAPLALGAAALGATYGTLALLSRRSLVLFVAFDWLLGSSDAWWALLTVRGPWRHLLALSTGNALPQRGASYLLAAWLLVALASAAWAFQRGRSTYLVGPRVRA